MSVEELRSKKCKPCEGGMPALAGDRAQELLGALTGWRLNENKIAKEFSFKDFRAAMRFVNRLADVAETEGHHPDIFVRYNRVTVTLWTHAVNGLTENDFIVAAKTDAIPN